LPQDCLDAFTTDALSVCQRASGFVPSIPGILKRFAELFKWPFLISAEFQKRESRGNSCPIAHVFGPTAANSILESSKGSVDPAAFQLFGGSVVLPSHVRPIISS